MYLFVNILHIYYIISKILTSTIVLFWNFFINKIWTFDYKVDIINKELKKDKFDIKYSIIIPAYNEERRIINTLKKTQKYFVDKKEKYEIIVVND